MLNYYRLERTSECRDMYFKNEGIFNFWGEYLLAHINNYNLVVVNRTGRKFHNIMSDEFFQMVDELEQRLEYDKQNTDLPKDPDYKRIEDFVVSANEEIIKSGS